MRKTVALFLVLTLILSLPVLPALAGDDPVGVWFLADMVYGGESYDPVSMGAAMSLEFRADGTYTLQASWPESELEVENGTWVLEDGIYQLTDDEGAFPQPFCLRDGRLVTSYDDGTDMVFARAGEAAAAPKPAPVPAESEEAFFGTWKLISLSSGGFTLTAENMDSSLERLMVVEHGKITAVQRNLQTGEADEETEEVSFMEDIGILAYMDREIGDICTLELMDDGTLCYTIPDGEDGFVFVFGRVE